MHRMLFFEQKTTNIFVFKIGAAVAEPFSDSSLVTLLTELSKTVTMEFVILLACSIMAFILMCLFIGAADISFMMR